MSRVESQNQSSKLRGLPWTPRAQARDGVGAPLLIIGPLFQQKSQGRPGSVEACKSLQSLSPRPSLPEAQPAPGLGDLGRLCFTPSSVNGPHWPCLGSHTPSVVLHPHPFPCKACY